MTGCLVGTGHSNQAQWNAPCILSVLNKQKMNEATAVSAG